MGEEQPALTHFQSCSSRKGDAGNEIQILKILSRAVRGDKAGTAAFVGNGRPTLII